AVWTRWAARCRVLGRARRASLRTLPASLHRTRPSRPDDERHHDSSSERLFLTGFDRHWERWVIHHRWHPLNEVFVWLSRIGTWGAVWIALGLVVAILLRRPPLVVAVVIADAAAQGLAGLLKTTTGVDRPPVRYPDTHA